ncbi:hypothetical protein J5S76_12290 [Bacillus amyloliquefaciens]|nr:hypothetical protein [Bacillus amyloliquefaciens]
MKLSSRVVIGKYIVCISMLIFSFIGMILAAVIIELALITISWFQYGTFDIMWSNIFHAVKLGGVGGGILGFGWILFYLFKVKGF